MPRGKNTVRNRDSFGRNEPCKQNPVAVGMPILGRCVIQPGPTGLNRFGARGDHSCPNHLQVLGGFRLTEGSLIAMHRQISVTCYFKKLQPSPQPCEIPFVAPL